MSVFALQDGAVHHTYSTYARGVEALMGTYQFLDLAPWGRNEDGLEFPLVASPRRVRQALSQVVGVVGARDGRSTTHVFQRASQRAFFRVSALLFAASAAATSVWRTSMPAMGEMPMLGAGRCRWRGCRCADRRGPAPRRRSSNSANLRCRVARRSRERVRSQMKPIGMSDRQHLIRPLG